MVDEVKMREVREVLNKNNLVIMDEDKNKLGKGGYGTVFEVRDKKNEKMTYAAKVIIVDSDDIKKIVKEFRGVNIIKINKEIETEDKKIYIVIMELSTMGDLTKLYFKIEKTSDGEKKNLSFLTLEEEKKIFKQPFLEKFGDNLTRFFVKQMISALKTFYQGNLVHFDIKPLNILLFKNLEIKLIDFGFLKRLDDPDTKKRIPGGTPGYVSPEYYYNYKLKGDLDDESLRKQDYFAIGATIYFLKYGKEMLDYKAYPRNINDINNNNQNNNNQNNNNQNNNNQNNNNQNNRNRHINNNNQNNNNQNNRNRQQEETTEEEHKAKIKIKSSKELTGDVLIYSLDKAMYDIKSQKFQDKDFDEFLCQLIQFKPKDRPDFEHIIRNKWLNKNLEEIDKISKINSFDESNLILELQKSDFLINNSRKYRKNFDEKNELDNINYKNNKKGKFKFGKRKKNIN